MTNSLKAFTIIELMVVSALTVITASAAFSAIGIFSELFDNFQDEASNEIQLVEFKERLKQDFQNCYTATREDNLLTLSMDSMQVGYQFETNKIARINLSNYIIVDSINYNAIEFQSSYKNEMVTEQMIDQLQIQFLDGNVQRSFQVTKEYSGEEKLAYVR